MTLTPTSIDELRQMVSVHSRVSFRGGGTKPGLSSPVSPSINLSRLSGIVAHTPEECTFTLRAVWPLTETLIVPTDTDA